jgi:hypothetical protein
MSNTMESFTRTYNSFSGVDMVVTFNRRIIGEVQGISYTIQREKAPVYTMGAADPRSFSRGKRGIAGSMVFMVFDRSALLDSFQDSPFLAWVTEFASLVNDPIVDAPSISVNAIDGTVGADDNITGGVVQSVKLDKVLARPVYHDQILPFEVVVTAVNEYGSNSKLRIHGVEILNCGSGMSIDDITTDEACTWIARAITNWEPGSQVKIPNFTLPTTVAENL